MWSVVLLCLIFAWMLTNTDQCFFLASEMHSPLLVRVWNVELVSNRGEFNNIPHRTGKEYAYYVFTVSRDEVAVKDGSYYEKNKA